MKLDTAYIIGFLLILFSNNNLNPNIAAIFGFSLIVLALLTDLGIIPYKTDKNKRVDK